MLDLRDPAARRPAQPAESVAGTATAPAGAAAVLDAQALARLAELDPGGKAGLVQRVLDTYAKSGRRLIEQLQTAHAAGDAATVRHAAHTLKSSSASVGALELSSLCAATEALVRDGRVSDGAAYDENVGRLLAEGRRVLDGLGAAA